MYVLGGSFIGVGRIIGNPVLTLLLFILTFSIFMACFFKTKYLALTMDGKIWLPFLAWTILGAILYAVPSFMFMYSVAFIILCIAIGNNMKEIFPYKLIFILGVILFIGQIMQMQLPGLYHLISKLLFGSELKEMGSGFQGFTNQTSTAATILTYALCAYLYFYASKKKYYINVIVISLLLIAVFLTGKRSMSFVVIFVPTIVLLVSTKSKDKIIKVVLPLVVIGIIAFQFIVSYSDNLNEVAGFKKVSQGLEMFMDDDEEIDTNGREILWETALRGYEENPVFGIGVSQFENWYGLPTNAHNMYLQVLCEQGGVGLLCFVIPLIFCLLHTIYLIRNGDENDSDYNILQFSLYIQLYFIIYGLSGNPTRNPHGYMMYFCAIGLLQSYQRRISLEEIQR